MVIGTFKNGKSTFINSLLEEDVLTARALPATAVINEVKYGEEKDAILYFRNPLPENLPASISQKALAHMQKHNMRDVPPLHIDYHELEDYVVIPIGEDPKEMLLESPYEKVELFWPLEMLKEGVEIIDSPGLEEDDTRTRVTMDYLTKADAILFVLTADKLCSKAELDFIENNLHEFGFTDPFFIVNRFDLIPDNQREELMRFAKMKLGEFSTNEIFYVSEPAQFLAQNETVRAAIESQVVQLRESLEAQGIKIEQVEVAVASQGFDRNRDNSQGQGGSADNGQQPGGRIGRAGRIRRIDLNAMEGEEMEDLDDADRIAAEMMASEGNTVDYTV
jgi:GTPase SAR1 family protein